MPEFIVQQDGRFERVHAEGRELVVGREEGVDIRIDDPSVSRQHARLALRGEHWVLEDLGSGNGTWVGDDRIARVVLARGDDFRVGPATLTFLGDAASPAPAAAPTSEATAEEGSGVAAAPLTGSMSRVPRIEGAKTGAELTRGLFGERWALRFDDGREGELTRIDSLWWDEPRFRTWIEESLRDWKELEGADAARAELRIVEGEGALIVESRTGPTSLQDRIDAEKRLGQKESVDVLLQLLDLIDRAHEKGLRLWGLRPERVRFGDGGRLIVAWPGLPIGLLERSPEGDAKALNALPPEAFSADGVFGRRSDVFGLGAVAHAALLGLPTADGRTHAAIAERALKGIYKSPRERRPGLVEDLAELMAEMLAPSPSDRPEDLVAIRRRLREIRTRAEERPERKGEPMRLEAKERELGERPSTPQRSMGFRMKVWGILFGMFLVLNAILFWFLRKYLFKI
ncbi:MAG: serine/threonine-protein kinase [Planctomycetota bacterium]